MDSEALFNCAHGFEYSYLVASVLQTLRWIYSIQKQAEKPLITESLSLCYRGSFIDFDIGVHIGDYWS